MNAPETKNVQRKRLKSALWRARKWLLLLVILTLGTGVVQLGIQFSQARKARLMEPYCQNWARKIDEPYDNGYRLRHQTINPRGPQYSYYAWTGKILRSEFEQTQNKKTSTLTVKVVENVLYAKDSWNRTDLFKSVMPRRDILIFQLLLTLHLYSIPDLEITFNMEDATMCNVPFVAYNVDARCGEKAGFTIPSFDVFQLAFGPKQIDRYLSCLDRSFPLEKSKRVMKAVWRGSTTGSPQALTQKSLPKFERFQLISLGDSRPDIFDVGFTNYVQLGGGNISKILKKVAPLKPFLPIDDFNKYAVILDLDGNAWSDRFSKLLFYNTPVLKQASPWKEYFARLVEPLMSNFTFQRNLSDLVAKVEDMLQLYEDSEGVEQLEQHGRDQRAFAQEHFSQLAVLRATAYTLTVYSEKQSWQVTLNEDDHRIRPDLQHPYCDRFPKDLIEEAFHDF